MNFTESLLSALCIVGAMGCEDGQMVGNEDSARESPGDFVEPNPDHPVPVDAGTD